MKTFTYFYRDFDRKLKKFILVPTTWRILDRHPEITGKEREYRWHCNDIEEVKTKRKSSCSDQFILEAASQEVFETFEVTGLVGVQHRLTIGNKTTHMHYFNQPVLTDKIKDDLRKAINSGH